MMLVWVQPGPGPADVEEEALEQLLAVLGVLDLGVELDPQDAPFPVLQGGHRSVGAGGRGHEARRHLGHGVAVAHPHVGVGVGGPVGEQAARSPSG